LNIIAIGTWIALLLWLIISMDIGPNCNATTQVDWGWSLIGTEALKLKPLIRLPWLRLTRND